jgi:LacI family transcriptional regulator
MVAKEAGVSPSTVSRILNGTARVRDSKVRAVEAAIAKLQFMPNRGCLLAGGKSSWCRDAVHRQPVYGESLASIEKGLLRGNYSPLFVSGHWREGDERRCVDHLLSRRVEGIILLTSCLPDSELANLSRNVPLTLTGRNVRGERIYCLDVDSTMGARLATDYLIGQGHRQIAFISGSPNHPDALQRLDGYKAALVANKIPFARKLVAPGYQTAYCRDHAAGLAGGVHRRLCRERPDTHGAMLALHRRGLNPAGRPSLVSMTRRPRLHDPATHHRAQAHRRDRRRCRGDIDLIEDAPTRQGSFTDARNPGIDPSLQTTRERDAAVAVRAACLT